MEQKSPVCKPVGDGAVSVVFDEKIDLAINQQVHYLDELLRKKLLEGVIETTPAYCTLLVHYDPLILTYEQVCDWILQSNIFPTLDKDTESHLIEIPAVYGGKYGPDLDFVARSHQLNTQQVVELHSRVEYRVFMMGFTPGFPYLGGLDAGIATPRLKTPRAQVPVGSIGIAGMQTGIYPVDSPGGWQIIAYTPLQLFDKQRNPPSLLSPGDRVRFIPISEEELSHVD